MLSYACPSWINAGKDKLQRMAAFDRNSLNKILDLPIRTPTQVTEYLSHIPIFTDYIMEFSMLQFHEYKDHFTPVVLDSINYDESTIRAHQLHREAILQYLLKKPLI